MAKRHITQNKKQSLGQFFTSNADIVLHNFSQAVAGKHVIDPFAGGKDLLNWATAQGALSVLGYDIEPTSNDIIKNDSIKNPPLYGNCFVLTNPPYLSKNKHKGDKSVFDYWGMDNLYKCHLASLAEVEEFIAIIPVNFFCESRDSIRRKVFSTHKIVKATYWTDPIFDDATVCVTVIHCIKERVVTQSFPLTFCPTDLTIDVELSPQYNYLHGKEFFDYVNTAPLLNITKVDVGMNHPNTNIVVGLLDNGKWDFGISYNENDPIYCQPKSFTTYQINVEGIEWTLKDQQKIVNLFQDKMKKFREKYHSLFLSNYMGPEQKILSRSYANRLISAVAYELGLHAVQTNANSMFDFS